VSIELNVCDTQPSCLGGGNNEFIFSGRLDNLASSYCALRALIDSCESSSDLSNDTAVRMIALFDNEEVILVRHPVTQHRDLFLPCMPVDL
jgi:aspartyl aminopeptidase